jgi:hypothetical protein
VAGHFVLSEEFKTGFRATKDSDYMQLLSGVMWPPPQAPRLREHTAITPVTYLHGVILNEATGNFLTMGGNVQHQAYTL